MSADIVHFLAGVIFAAAGLTILQLLADVRHLRRLLDRALAAGEEAVARLEGRPPR